ncbi:MAG: SDR family NAD(P)-dependent oxidoreductase [Oscillospiraceae bacterium]|nr:SDR family NAD(P)-dependent oxidoreductase [Oscillospiraceae bacterium]MDD4367322.1 SDR family NAD(P)-dependent oxidoreductase [Oscillospiraceae bacterium]
MQNLFDFSGRVVVVTGASSGLGADAARAFAEHGADVALLARRKEKLETVVSEITAGGHKALAVVCDVCSEDSVKAAITEVLAQFGKIDVLVNNAGIAQGGSVETLTTEQWDKSMDTNVRSIFLTGKYVIPQMKKNHYGRIVNVASVNAILADKAPQLVRHVYNASKAAVLGITKGMAASYAQDNITVNAVGPGLFESEMTAGTLFTNQSFMQMYNALCPASRPGARGELNGPLLFFGSESASYTTGQFITVDGGFALV